MVLIKNPVWHMLARWISNALSEKKWGKRELETVRMGGPGEGELEMNSEGRNVLSHVGIKLSCSTYQRILFPGTG